MKSFRHCAPFALLLWLATLPAFAQQCVAGFPEVYGELFADALRALPDAKAMVDAIPRQPPASIPFRTASAGPAACCVRWSRCIRMQSRRPDRRQRGAM